MLEPFVVGSEHQLESYITDRVGDTLVPLDLTGATVVYKLKIGTGSTKTLEATIDPNQSGNTGRVYRDLLETDIDAEGAVYLQALVTIEDKAWHTKIVETYAQATL